MMNFNEFQNEVKETMQRMYENAEVMVMPVNKNNVTLVGLNIRESSSSVSPTIYLEDFYQAYTEGKGMNEIVHDIQILYEKSRATAPTIDTSNIYDKRNVVFRLVNKERNDLSNVPHREIFGDLVLQYRIVVNCDNNGVASALQQ